MLTLTMFVAWAACTSQQAQARSAAGAPQQFDWSFGQGAEKTYLFTNAHWWESIDHQLTTIITLLTLAQNTSCIAVIPFLASANSTSNVSLLGHYYDLPRLRQVQPVITLSSFLQSTDYVELRGADTSTIALPKESQEEYEGTLGIYGKLHDSVVKINMPDVDPENTNQRCDRFGGSMHVSHDGRIRYVFLDRLHFMHFCAERFMPWWYDVRQHIRPRSVYMDLGERFVRNALHPLTVVHVNDVMEGHKARVSSEVEGYAGQIVDGLRAHDSVNNGGAIYAIYNKNGRNVRRVVSLLQAEITQVYECSNLFGCLADATADMTDTKTTPFAHFVFDSEHAAAMTEWAVAAQAHLFIGNVHSPFSRNVCLYRKMQGSTYVSLRGFAELRKVWTWNL